MANGDTEHAAWVDLFSALMGREPTSTETQARLAFVENGTQPEGLAADVAQIVTRTVAPAKSNEEPKALQVFRDALSRTFRGDRRGDPLFRKVSETLGQRVQGLGEDEAQRVLDRFGTIDEDGELLLTERLSALIAQEEDALLGSTSASRATIADFLNGVPQSGLITDAEADSVFDVFWGRVLNLSPGERRVAVQDFTASRQPAAMDLPPELAFTPPADQTLFGQSFIDTVTNVRSEAQEEAAPTATEVVKDGVNGLVRAGLLTRTQADEVEVKALEFITGRSDEEQAAVLRELLLGGASSIVSDVLVEDASKNFRTLYDGIATGLGERSRDATFDFEEQGVSAVIGHEFGRNAKAETELFESWFLQQAQSIMGQAATMAFQGEEPVEGSVIHDRLFQFRDGAARRYVADQWDDLWDRTVLLQGGEFGSAAADVKRSLDREIRTLTELDEERQWINGQIFGRMRGWATSLREASRAPGLLETERRELSGLAETLLDGMDQAVTDYVREGLPAGTPIGEWLEPRGSQMLGTAAAGTQFAGALVTGDASSTVGAIAAFETQGQKDNRLQLEREGGLAACSTIGSASSSDGFRMTSRRTWRLRRRRSGMRSSPLAERRASKTFSPKEPLSWIKPRSSRPGRRPNS